MVKLVFQLIPPPLTRSNCRKTTNFHHVVRDFFHVNLPIVIVTAYRQVVVPDSGASPREESRLSASVSLFSTDQRPLRVPKHEWNASCDGRCTRETTALERNGPVDSPAQGRTIIARALRRATTDCPWPSAS